MTIFYEVATRLIRTTCEEALTTTKGKEEGWGSFFRNHKLSEEKQGQLRRLIAELATLEEKANDETSLLELQTFLRTYIDTIVAKTVDRTLTEVDTSGTTEQLLEHLINSLHPTFIKFGELRLVNIAYDKEDGLHAFYCFIGLYHAHRKLLGIQEAAVPASLTGVAKGVVNFVASLADRFHLLPDTKTFLDEQKALIFRYFNMVPSRIKKWEERHKPTAQEVVVDPFDKEEKAGQASAYVYRLRDEITVLNERQSAAVKATPTFKDYSALLNTLLGKAIVELNTLWNLPPLQTAAAADTPLASSLHQSAPPPSQKLQERPQPPQQPLEEALLRQGPQDGPPQPHQGSPEGPPSQDNALAPLRTSPPPNSSGASAAPIQHADSEPPRASAESSFTAILQTLGPSDIVVPRPSDTAQPSTALPPTLSAAAEKKKEEKGKGKKKDKTSEPPTDPEGQRQHK